MEASLTPSSPAPKLPAAEKLEGIAFQFCKIATVSLLAGRYTLPVAAGLCSILYIAAYAKGKRDSRCVLRYPLLIAALWGAVTVAWITIAMNPSLITLARRQLER